MKAEPPPIVWTLWLQGWEEAPPIVKSCLETWRRRNPGWELRALDRESAAAHVDLGPYAGLPPAALSDVIRIELLRAHGGVWADATLYCVAPLDSWLPDRCGQGFFAFGRPGPDRMLASWFLAAAPGSPLVAAWSERVREYWRGRDAADEYFWFHHLFAAAYREDAAVRAAWDAVPALSANGPHYFAPDYARSLSRPLRPHVRQRLLSATDPVYKLSHRLDGLAAGPGSTYEFLRAWAEREPAPALAAAPGLALRMDLDRGAEALRWRYRDARARLLSAARARRRSPRPAPAPRPPR